MKITYDKIDDILYVTLKKCKIERTVPINDWTLVDVDKNGEAVGIEVHYVTARQAIEIPNKFFSGAIPSLVI